MLVIPAVDIRRGEVVRLEQGDYDREAVYEKDPVAAAVRFAEAGARRIHVVDLDAAREGRFTALDIVREICRSVDADVDMGGGVRSVGMIEEALSAGVMRVVIGTLAAVDPPAVEEACRRFPGRITVSIDSTAGRVAVRGWTELADITAGEFAAAVRGRGVDEAIVTDISRDGMLSGLNLDAALAVAEAGLKVIAAGGVRDLGDIRRAVEAASHQGNLVGVITGRAIYTGDLDLAEAIRVAGGG